MSKDAEMWDTIHKDARQKKRNNIKSSLQILKDRGIKYETLSEGSAHYRINDWNFWPSTGKFYNQKTNEKDRGIFNLLKKIKT